MREIPEIGSLPSLFVLVISCLAGLVWSYLCLCFAGYLRCTHGWRTGYTRKTFHLLIFATVACLHQVWGLVSVCVFGAMTTVVIAYGLLRGTGHPLYEAIARESDRPRRTYYVVIPYFATLIGGVASNLLFGPLALAGYLVGGIGDAAGEPVGTRWGKHRYQISWLGQSCGIKSVEGSIAILVVSMLVLFVFTLVNLQPHFGWHSFLAVALIAFSVTLVEAASPRGWDNTPMQIVPTFLAFLLLRS
jgi:phytol kinase